MQDSPSLSLSPGSASSPRKTLFLIEKEAEETLQRADPLKVQSYVDSHSLRKQGNEGKWEKFSMNCDLNDFGRYGIGLTLYLNFLKKTAIVFVLMALISIPALVANIIGNGSDQVDFNLVQTTLANQPNLKVDFPANLTVKNYKNSNNYQFFMGHVEKTKKSYKDEVDNNILFVALPDLFYSVLFFFFVIYLRNDSNNIIQRHSTKTVMMSDFALKVSGFPGSVNQPDDLFKHFEQFGEVIEVCLARNYSNTLFDYNEAALIQRNIQIEEKRLEFDVRRSRSKYDKLVNKRDNILNRIEQRLNINDLKDKKHDEYPSLYAFIVFNDASVVKKVLEIYTEQHKFNFKRFFLECNHDLRRIMPKHLQLNQKYPLKVSKVSNPSDILWENLDCSDPEKGVRKFISAIIILVIMLLTFGIIFGAGILGSTTNSFCPKNFEKLAKEELATYTKDLINACYCSKFSSTQIYLDSNLLNKCYDYAVKLAGFQVLSVASGFIIVIVNIIMKLVLLKLAKFEKYNTLTEETIANVFKVFVAMFVNTALIPLFIAAQFGGDYNENKSGIIISREIGKIIPVIGDYIESKQTQYPNDFNRLWYTNVGNKILITWIINMFYPYLFNLAMSPLINFFRRRSSRNAFIQDDMNKFAVGPQFMLVPKYAFALNTIFVTLFYCSGMPILLFFASISLIMQFWVEKYLLINYYARPPNYEHQVNTFSLRALPFALILHLAIGIYAYGSENIFLKNPVFKIGDNDVPVFQSSLNVFNELIAERVSRVLFLFILMLIFAGVFLFDISLFRLISHFLKSSKGKVADEAKNKITYNECKEILKYQDIASYEIKGNPNYINLVNVIDNKQKHLNKSANNEKDLKINMEMVPLKESKENETQEQKI